jgi:Ca2+-binding RTX toxin-like protein
VAVVPGTVQQVIASPGGSNLQAGPGNVTLVGGPGNDWLAAGSGTQRLIGGGGTDTLIAGVGTDELDGGTQPVTFIPGQGTDTLNSQMTTPGNTLSYAGVPSGARVNLSNQVYSVPAGEPFAGTSLNPAQATGGWGAMVTLTGAEIGNVVGSPAADIFVTGSSGDTVSGNGGADLFVVTGGNNTLTAGSGSGSRFLFDAAGSNIINGGGLSTADFSLAPAGVKVNLQQGQATGGFGGLEAISGFVNVIGSDFNDVLVAGAPGGQLTGLNGNDLLQAGPAGGNILVGGGSGNDTFCAAAVCAVSGTIAGGGDSMLGSSGDDTFFARNGVSDSINGGGGDNAAQVDAALDHVTNIQQLLP